MDDEFELISDGDGLAVLGDPTAVERYLAAEGLPSRDLGLPRLVGVLSTGAAAAQAGSEIGAYSGRWVKLTPKSAAALKRYEAMKGSSADVSRAVLTQKGKTKHILEFVKTPKSLLTNPAVLAGAAGIMAQLAMQQTMDEITDYLATIDAKVDDVLRAQKDAVLSPMIGAGLVIDEAIKIREHVGRVSEVTWSKVQTVPGTIADTQAYALTQLESLAEKMERESGIGDLAKSAKDAESTVREWLAVLARCFQLQDAIAVLELDRVLDASPDDLDGHCVGLKAARQDRRELICRTTGRLVARMDSAAGLANTRVLLHPTGAGALVRSSNLVSGTIVDFHGLLGIEHERESLEAKRWVAAVADARDKALVSGVEGVRAAKRRSTDTLGRARSVTGKLSNRAVERATRWRGTDEKD